MSQKVVQSIFDLARGEEFGCDRADLSVFIAQLFAWCKVSSESNCPKDLSIWGTLEVNEPKGYLKDAFSKLESADFLDGNGSAFELDKSLLESIPHSFIIKAIQTLKSAHENKVINYREVLNGPTDKSKHTTEPVLSPPLIALMVELVGIEEGDSVYCPFDNSFGLARASSKKSTKIYSETSQETRVPYLLNLLEGTTIVHRAGNIISAPSWVEDGKLMMFDRSLVNPPFGMRYPKETTDWFDRFPFETYYGEALQVWHVLAQTKKRAVVLVPHSILVRTSGGEKDFKKQLIEGGFIEAIIDLPAAILPFTNVRVALLVLNKEPSGGVLFIDATNPVYDSELNEHHDLDIDLISKILENKETSKISYVASWNECRQNDFNLLVNRYVVSDEQQAIQRTLAKQKTIPLGELAELIRPQAVRDKKQKEDGTEYREVMVSDLPDTGYINDTKRTVFVSEKNKERAKQQRLAANDILVSIKGTIGKIGLIPESFADDQQWLAGQSLQIVRCKENSKLISSIVLYMYLKSPIAQSLLASRASGMISMIQVRDIKSLPVPIPSAEEQRAIIETFNEKLKLKNKITALEAELGNLSKRHWDIELS